MCWKLAVTHAVFMEGPGKCIRKRAGEHERSTAQHEKSGKQAIPTAESMAKVKKRRRRNTACKQT